jgi:transposase-like protein
MKKCTKCESENYVKAGFRKTADGTIQKYKCKECNREFTGQEKYKRLSEDQIKLIEKMYEEKGEQRKIARILGVHLGTVQHHLKKN